MPLGWLLQLVARLSRRRVGVVLLFHRVGESAGDPARELLPAHDVRLLEAELRHLRRWYRVVPASELLDAARARRRASRFPIALTFDDDLASHARVVLPLLRRHGVQATFFLTGASLEGPSAFWWQDLQTEFDRGTGSPTADIFGVAQRTRDLPAAERRAVAEELRRRAGGVPDAGLRGEDVRELSAAGMAIGFHTREHHALTTLDDDELSAAMRTGRDELEAQVGRPLELIAYPHGAVDDRTPRAAREAGFRYGFTTEIGPVSDSSDPLLQGRMEVTFRSLGEFAMRLAWALALGR